MRTVETAPVRGTRPTAQRGQTGAVRSGTLLQLTSPIEAPSKKSELTIEVN